MTSSLEKKIITSGFALVLLAFLGSAAQITHTSILSFLCSSLSFVLFLLVFYYLKHQITRHRVVEANFRDLYNNAPCGYYSLDLDGIFIAINDTALNWLDYSREQVIGKLKISNLLTPESVALFQENFTRIQSQGWVKDLEIQMIRKNGTILPVLLNSTAIRDATGNLVGTRNTIFDITDRKQAQEELRQSEERFRLAVDNIPDTFVIYDQHRRFQFVNAEGLRRTGLPLEALLGRTDEEIHPPEVTDNYLPTLLRAIETRSLQTTECTITLPTIDTFTVVATYVPLLNEKGEIYQILGITHDLTKRKQTEAALAASEKRLRTIIEAEPECVKVLGLDGTIQEINAAGLAMIEADDLQQVLGQPACSLVVPKYRGVFTQLTQQASQENSGILEFEIIGLKGTHRWLESHTVPLHDENNEITGVLSITRDITAQKQAQEALRQSEERLRLALEATNMGTWDWNILTNQVTFSSKSEQLFGLVSGSFDGRRETVEECVHPEDQKAIRQAINRALIQHKDYDHEFRVVWSDGSIHWLEGKGKFFYDETDQAVRMVGIVMDISDRKHREEQLRLLESVVINTNDAVLITEAEPIDPPGPRIIYTNPAFTRMTGYSLEEVRGKTPRILQGAKTDRITLDRIRSALESWQPVYADSINYRKDGSEYWVELSIVPVRNQTGGLTHWVAVQRDITARKLAEAALQQSEQKFRQLAENIHEVFWMSKADVSEILYVSPAYEEIWGRSCESLYANPKSFLNTIHPDDKEWAIANLEHNPTGSFDIEYRIVRPDGELRWIRDRGFPIQNESGEIYRRAGIAQDITQRKQAEEMLRRANEDLEIRVQQRTTELCQANERLQRELFERQQVENSLKRAYQRLQFHVANTPLAVIEWNSELRLMNWSKRAEKMFGWSIEEVIGNYPTDWRFIHQEDAEQVSGIIERLLKGLESSNLSRNRNYTKNGTVIECEWYNSALFDASGNLVSILSLIQDVTERKQAEVALRESKELLQAIVDNSPMIIYLIDTKNRHLLTNRGYDNLLSLSKEQLIGQSLYDVWPHDIADVFATNNRTVLENGTPIEVEEIVPQNNGLRTYTTIKFPLHDTNGVPYAVCGISTDITERKQVEEERTKLIAILEATPDIVASANMNEQITYLNKAARSIFGLGKNDNFDNLKISNLHPDWAYQLVHNEGIPAAIRDGVWVGETAFLNQEGGEIPVSQVIIAHKSPDGSVKMLSTIGRDITQQKKIAATLFEAERRWRSLLENVRLAVIGLDTYGKVEYVNPFFLELVGYTKAEVIGQDWFEVFLPSYQRKRLQNNFITLLEEEFYKHNQNVILTKSGEEKVIAWNNTLLQNSQGYVIGTLSIGEDITERQVIERMKDEFISVVSHEIRTPLTSIHGALNLLASGLVDTQTDKGRRVIEIAAESSERLVRLVNDILDLERLESGKISLLKQWCNAAELMTKATELMQVMANRAGMTLSVFPQAIAFNADPDRIIQVLTNLVGNAIKFSPRGSTVWLTVELQGTRETGRVGESENCPCAPPHPLPPSPTVLFTVKDQGRGIPADNLESIFERFHQVDASDSRKKGGTGLGLAICRSIVQQHGGQIWVESTLGEGSSFYFTLPVVLEDESHDNQAHLGD